MWEAELFPGLSVDSLATAVWPAQADFRALYVAHNVPIAGAQIILPIDEIIGSYTWFKQNILDPAGDKLGQLLTELGKAVFGGVISVIAWLFDKVYGLERSVLLGFMAPGDKWQFPAQPFLLPIPPHYLLWLMVTMPFYALKNVVHAALGYAAYGFPSLAGMVDGRMSAWVDWLRVQVTAALGYAAYGFPSLAGMVDGRMSAWVDWLRVQVTAALGYAAYGATSLAGMVDNRLSAWANWTVVNVTAGLGFAARGFLNLGDLIWQRTYDMALWVWEQAKTIPNLVIGGLRFPLGYAAYGFLSLGGLIWQRTYDMAAWVWGNTLTKIDDLALKLPDMVISGGAFVLEGVAGIFKEIFLGPLDFVVGTVNRKLAIPGKLLSGAYPNLAALLNDIADPPPELMKGFTMYLLIPFIIAGLIVSFGTTLGDALVEPVRQEQRRNIGAQLLARSDLQEARWRGLAVDVDYHLGRYGFDVTSRAAIAEIDKRIPGPSDLVRFAVREAFDPGQAAELGFVTPLPGEFASWLKKQGFENEWAERYWWAHWDLPSVSQGFEMFHRLRDTFKEPQLRGLLKALDVPPLWHDRFIQISYNPLTRVDVRRMYNVDVLSEQDVYNAYLDIGYSPTNAQRLTDFAKRLKVSPSQGGRDLVASDIRLSYRRHVITRDEAFDRLIALGYAFDEAEFLLAIDDTRLAADPGGDTGVNVRDLTSSIISRAYREGLWDRARAQDELETLGYLPWAADLILSLEDIAQADQLTDAQVAIIRQQYLAFDLDNAGARAQLQALDIPAQRQDLLLAQWAAERQAGTRKLSVANVTEAWKKDFFTDDQALNYLLRLGYNQTDASLILTLA